MKQDKMMSKELIERIRSKVPKSIYKGNAEDIEIKIALYVYIELAKSKSFDERYYLGNDKLAKRIVKQAYEDSKDENGESPYYYPEYTIRVLKKLLQESEDK